MQGFSRIFKVGENSEGIRPSKESKEGIVMRDHRRTSSQGKEQAVKIICREFMNFREPLDLTKEEGSYHEHP
jgi:hypothetical protein